MAEFAHMFGLKPAEVDALTVEQFEDFRRYADEYRRQMREAAKNQG